MTAFMLNRSLWIYKKVLVPQVIGLRSVFKSNYRQESTLPNQIRFDDHSSAYTHLTSGEVLRAWFVLKLCSLDFILQNSIKLLETSQKMFGGRFLEQILRPTLYEQFVAGDDLHSLEMVARKLKNVGIKLMVLPSLEEDVGQSHSQPRNRYDANAETTLKLADLVSRQGGPFSCLQTKITALINADLMLKIAERNKDDEDLLRTVSNWANYMTGGHFTELPYLSAFENLELEKGLERLKFIGASAVERELRLLVDGEYTYINRVVSMAALSMAGAFNQARPVVWNTYQCYLKDAFAKASFELEATRRMGVCFGAKIVRGAYLARERELSVQNNYPDPTNPSYEATSANYDRVVATLMEHIAHSKDHPSNIIVATHNEASVLKAISKMASLGIKPNENKVVFGQIYGMALNVTVKLASEGYIVYNSVPYGSLFDVLPYLSRRATENRAVLKGTRRERVLLGKELRRRLIGI